MAVGGRREPTDWVDRVQIVARQSLLSASGISIFRCPTACFVTRDAIPHRVTNTRVPQIQVTLRRCSQLPSLSSSPIPHPSSLTHE